MIGTIVIKAVKACNLRCTYCYYINADTEHYGQVISEETAANLYRHIADYAPQDDGFVLIWHGGEPLMLGRRRFEKLLDLQSEHLKSVQIRNVVQTNGTLITRDWIDFFNQYNVGVGISIDSDREAHDQNRRTVRGRPTYDKVIDAFKLFGEMGRPVGALSVIDGRHDGAKAIRNIDNLGVTAYDLLLPITNNALQESDRIKSYGSFTDMSAVSTFLLSAFEEWLAHPELDVRLFRSLLRNALGLETGYLYAGDTSLDHFVVLEPNGDVSLDPDFWHIDRFGLGSMYSMDANVNDPGFTFSHLERTLTAFVDQHNLNKLPADCQDCTVRSVCRGSHPASRFGADGSFNHRSAYCQALYDLSRAVIDYIIKCGHGDHLVDDDLKNYLSESPEPAAPPTLTA